MYLRTPQHVIRAFALVVAFGAAAGERAQPAAHNAEAVFEDCTEFVGIAPVSLAEAQALVPPVFSIVDAGGAALLVIRISNCREVSVGNSLPRPGTVAHIGINIVPPDGLGDINNYTLTYVSDIGMLVKKLRASGLPARHDVDLLYEFTRDSGMTGNLLGIVTPATGITWHVYGRESDPEPGSAFPFRAIWWYATPGHMVRMDTTFPAIAFGDAQVSFHTPDETSLRNLLGGGTIAAFPGLSVRGVFDSAQMTVTTSP